MYLQYAHQQIGMDMDIIAGAKRFNIDRVAQLKSFRHVRPSTDLDDICTISIMKNGINGGWTV